MTWLDGRVSNESMYERCVMEPCANSMKWYSGMSKKNYFEVVWSYNFYGITAEWPKITHMLP